MSYKYCPHCGEPLPKFEGGSPFGLPAYAKVEEGASPERPTHYNQTNHWRSLLELANTLRANKEWDIVLPKSFLAGKTVVHMVFDKGVCPAGGLMYNLVRNVSGTQEVNPPRLSPVELETMGYELGENGKVKLVDNVPVGPIYGVLQYWGGESQRRRWHMSHPIELNPNKKGDPAFMDDNLVAFVARWKERGKMDYALSSLSELLSNGIRDGKKVGRPRLIDVFPIQ